MVKLYVSPKAFTLTGSVSEVLNILRLLAQSKLTVEEWLRRANC